MIRVPAFAARRVCVALASLVTIVVAAPVSPAQFAVSPIPIGGGLGPHSIASGDLNGDGNRDLVTGDYLSDDFTSLLGNGAGAFAPLPVPFPMPTFGTQTGTIALADINGDHFLDLVSTTYYTSSVAVVPGNGVGGFGPATATAIPSTCTAVQAADFTGDGRSDVVTSSYFTDEFYLLKNTGGVLALTPSIPFGPPLGTRLGRFAVGDVTLDGKLDLVSATYYTGGVAVLPGDGLGGFLPPMLTPSGTAQTIAVALGDLDGDGAPDAVVTDTALNLAIVFVNAGGVLNLSFVGPIPFASAADYGIEIGDVDDSGIADVVIAEPSGNDVAVYFGLGGFVFAPPVNVPTGAGPLSVTIGDFDSDGRVDLAAADSVSNDATLLRNVVPIPVALLGYGTGTAGCGGREGVLANQPPIVPSPAFGFTCSNASRNALGLGILGNVQDLAGSDPLSLGVLFHVDLFSLVASANFRSDEHGSAFAPLPIPANPGLIGLTLFAQAIWTEPPLERCTPSIFGLVSSKGLVFTLL